MSLESRRKKTEINIYAMNEDIKSDSEMKLLGVLESLCRSFLSLKAMVTNAFKRTIVGETRDTKPITIPIV